MDPKALILSTAGRLVLLHSKVTQVSPLSSSFVRFDVHGEELRAKTWTPGDKAQILIPPREAVRTFTPFDWRDGKASFLGFVHGASPASNWLRRMKAGDPVNFLEQPSLDVSATQGPLLVVGDETSIAVARAFSERREVIFALEAGDVEATREICARLGLTRGEIVPRGDLDALSNHVKTHTDAGATPVFTGRASTIQQIKKGLKLKGPTKAYWADGKRGLD